MLEKEKIIEAELAKKMVPYKKLLEEEEIDQKDYDAKEKEIRNELERIQKEKEQKEENAQSMKKATPFIIIAVVAIIAVIVYVSYVIPMVKYNKAQELIEAKEYSQAIEIFKELGSFKEAECMIDEVKAEALKNGEILYEVGETLTLGTYDKEVLEWRVIKSKSNKVMLLCEGNIDNEFYHEQYEPVTWEKCTLRKWLNSDFYSKTFTEEEKQLITTTSVKNKNNPEGAEGGKDTKDKIFLLSIEEAEALSHYILDIDDEWWLRSPGYRSDYAAYVDYTGDVDSDGDDVYDNSETWWHYSYGIRPALWLDVSNLKS